MTGQTLRNISVAADDGYFQTVVNPHPLLAHDLSPNMTCHQILNMSNMTGVTNGARNACPSGAPEEVVLIIL